jgi:hypothetical protein
MLTVQQAKNFFFDRAVVIAAIGREAAARSARAGALVRTIARNSMRQRKASSPRGSPPSSHAGQLKDLLFFGFDAASKTTIVGPVPFKAGIVPNLLEFGGDEPGVDRFGNKRTMHYAGNPFMAPALVKAAPELPGIWEGSVKG